MTIKELFDKNKGSKIEEWNKGVLREFFTYEDYITYLNNYFGDKVFKREIPRNVRLSEAPSHQQTIFEYENWSKGARAYRAVAKEFLEMKAKFLG